MSSSRLGNRADARGRFKVTRFGLVTCLQGRSCPLQPDRLPTSLSSSEEIELAVNRFKDLLIIDAQNSTPVTGLFGF